MKKSCLYLPNEKERNGISQQMWNKCGWVNCVGCLDGTLFPLCFKPRTEDFGDCYGRKIGCSVSALIASDEHLFIRHIQAGWPGCTHNDRIFAHSNLWNDNKNISHATRRQNVEH